MITNASNETGRSIRSQGYPGYLDSAGNPANAPTSNTNNDLFLATGNVVTDFCDYMKGSSARTYAGMSGGPVLYKNGSGKWMAGGIISRGNDSGNENLYCAFDNNLFNRIRSFI